MADEKRRLTVRKFAKGAPNEPVDAGYEVEHPADIMDHAEANGLKLQGAASQFCLFLEDPACHNDDCENLFFCENPEHQWYDLQIWSGYVVDGELHFAGSPAIEWVCRSKTDAEQLRGKIYRALLEHTKPSHEFVNWPTSGPERN